MTYFKKCCGKIIYLDCNRKFVLNIHHQTLEWGKLKLNDFFQINITFIFTK